MAESVDALVSNTSGATHPGSSPGLGTRLKKKEVVIVTASFSVFPLETTIAPVASTSASTTIASASSAITTVTAIVSAKEVEAIADVQHGI